MFKKASIFNITEPSLIGTQAISQAAEASAFVSCGPTQEKSVGWVPPRGFDHGAMVEVVGGQYIMKLMIETRSVPSRTIAEVVEQRCKAIEASTGRMPGRKEKRDLKEDTLLSLLPQAFPKKTGILLWVDPKAGLLVIDSTTTSKVSDVVSALVNLSNGLVITDINTRQSPTTLMTHWLIEGNALSSEERDGFDIGRTCEIVSQDETNSRIRYANYNPFCADVLEHINAGKLPTKLELTYEDRVVFSLAADGNLSGLKVLDVVVEDRSSKDTDDFDADAAILTGELSKLIQSLLTSLGGQVAGVAPDDDEAA